MKKIAVFTLLCLILPYLAAQSTGSDAIQPYVSKIKASVTDSQIIITWENMENVNQPIFVYKAKQLISADNISEAEKIASLEAGKYSYIFSPPDTEYYYFAVCYVLNGKDPVNVFIALRNITAKGVKVETIGTEEDLAATITKINVKTGEINVKISFTSSKPDRDLILYRSTSPLLTADDLFKANFFVALGKQATEYRDYPIAEIDYYYAVLDAGLLKIGKAVLVRNENTTTVPARLKMSATTGGQLTQKSNRSLPLPLLSLTAGMELGSDLADTSTILLPEDQKISQETAKTITQFLTTLKSEDSQVQDIQILDIDTIENMAGEAYTLQQIVNDSLKAKKYSESLQAIKDFLLISRAADVEARAHYYMGQIYYFQALYKEAFLEFLLASDIYYTESQPWLDSCFVYLRQAE